MVTKRSKYQLIFAPDAIKPEMIRERFVLGLNYGSLKERLFREMDISQDKMVILVQSTESSKQQVKEMM